MLRGGNNETDPESYEIFFFFTIASYCVPIPVNYSLLQYSIYDGSESEMGITEEGKKRVVFEA